MEAAFPTPAEADLVDRLRREGDSVFSLVAVNSGKLVGHIMFFGVEAPFRALGLGPIAVLPEHQRTGIGTRLIGEGLMRATRGGWEGVFVLGEPAYYRRFGFDASKASGFASPYAGAYFMALALGADHLPAYGGDIAYPTAFAALG